MRSATPSLADGDINADYSVLPENGNDAVDATVQKMVEMAAGKWGRESPKIRAAAINIVRGLDPITGERFAPQVASKDYYGMLEQIHNWVRDNIMYVKDVVGQETLSYPEETLFNSRAEDCDGQVILEMALLGSIGLQSYPVIVGMFPGHYSHVYMYAEVPPGRHRNADTTWAADPIMKDWPLGREAPADRVKAKKVYSNLAGFNMPLNGYASSDAAFSPQDELEATQVGTVLATRLTDSGGAGQIVNANRLTQWGDELDDMFNAEATVNPMQAAPASLLYARGPVVARAAREQTSYLSEAPLGGGRNRPGMRRGPLIITVKDKAVGDSVTKPKAPTVNGLMGLADYLGELAPIAKVVGKRMSVNGKRDALHATAAAAHLAKNQAKKATNRVVKLQRDGFMPGFGADMQPDKTLDVAMQIEKLAHQVSAQADQIAQLAAGSSPLRQQALSVDLGAMDYMNEHAAVSDLLDNMQLPNVPTKDMAKLKSVALVNCIQDPDVKQLAVDLAQTDLPTAPGARVKTRLPEGAIVRDQMGKVIQNGGGDDSLAGLGELTRKRRIKRALAEFNESTDTSAIANALRASANGLAGYANEPGLGRSLSQAISGVAKSVVASITVPVKAAVATVVDPIKLAQTVATGGSVKAALTSDVQNVTNPMNQALKQIVTSTQKAPSTPATPATQYEDANGNIISAGLYNSLMLNPSTPESCFDANGSALNTTGCVYAPGTPGATVTQTTGASTLSQFPGGTCFSASGASTGATGCFSPSTGAACWTFTSATTAPTATNAAPDCPMAPVSGYNPQVMGPYASGPGAQCFNVTTGQPTGVPGCTSPSTGAPCYSYTGPTTAPTPTNAAADCAGSTASVFASYPGAQCFNMTTGAPTGVAGCLSPSMGVPCYAWQGPSAAPIATNAAPDCGGSAYNPYAAASYGSGGAGYSADPSAYDPDTGESLTSTPDYSNQGPPDDSGFGPDQMGPASYADNSQQDENTVAVSASGGGGFDPSGNSGITAGGQSDSGDDGSDDGGSDDGGSDDGGTDDGSGDATDVSQYNAPSQAPKHKKHKYYNMDTDSGGDNSDTSDSGEASDDDSDLDTGINGDVATGDMYPEDDLNEDGGAGYGRGTALTPSIEGLGAVSASSLVKPALAIGLGIILWKTVGKKLFKRKRA
jgi:hypothetical protein